MRILLFGNPSMMHSNLAEGLRELGHEVTLVSHQYGWREFTGIDVCLQRRRDINGKISFILYLWQVLKLLPKWRNYDIVQFHNCGFLELRGKHLMPFYKYLRRYNKHIVLGVSDADYYVYDQITNRNILRYSEQRIGDEIIHNKEIDGIRQLYFGGWYEDWSKYVAKDCDAIVPVLYEYWVCYKKVFPNKTTFIPLAVTPQQISPSQFSAIDKVKIFIGLQRDRMQIKGTDILLKAAQDVAHDFPELCALQVVENVPYTEYERIMNESDILIDQLYSYTPAMNALLAMSKGIVVVSGGEPENYAILNETELRPIINVLPYYDDVYQKLSDIIKHKERIPELKRMSVEYIHRHHDYIKVAHQYLKLYESLMHNEAN